MTADSIWHALMPPADASKEELMRHRTISAGIVFALVINAIASYAIFARAADVKQVRTGQLDGQIWQARKEECQAPPGSPLREVLAKRRKELTDAYRDFIGLPYDLPDCSSFRS